MKFPDIPRARVVFNAVLILAAIALGSALWLTRERPAPPPESVSGLAPDAIRRLEVHYRDNVIVATREGERWQLQQPVDARADASGVGAALAVATAIPQHRYDHDALDDDATGLDDPALTLRFNDDAPIAVGGPGPSPGSRYVRTAHATLLIDAPGLATQTLGWSHWIAPGLLAPGARLTALVLPHLTLTQGDTGGWQVAPVGADRGADYAQATIDAWRHSRALSVEPADAARQREARVTLRFADQPDRSLDVIAREPDLILRDNRLGVDYHFAANHAGPMLAMRHPQALGSGRADNLQPSAIPLAPEQQKRMAK